MSDGDAKEVDFSIITPSYNYKRYIRDCVESVLGQEGVTYEHIVYDACSNDGTLDVLYEYEHIDLTVEPDKGMSDAINKGFKRARGKWVMWLNTDDRLKPGALAAVKHFAEKNTKADVIYGCWDFVNETGNFVRRVGVFPLRRFTLAHGHCYIGSTATFLRRETTIDLGILLNARFQYVMDSEYYLRLVDQGKNFVYFPRVLADFRMHGGNLSFRHMHKKNIDGRLDRELQLAEGAAIRRCYGITIFNNQYMDAAMDGILYWFFRLLKQPVKFFNRPQNKE